MKKKFILSIFIFISYTLFTDGVQPYGSGTQEDPYQVSILDNLLWISTNETCWNDYFLQIDDIDAEETSCWNDGNGFIPIGNSEVPFTGNYDGQNYIISNLHVTGQLIICSGLFGSIERSQILNLGLENIEIIGHGLVGGLAGISLDCSIVSNCFSTGYIYGDYTSVGGLVGSNSDSSIVVSSFSTCEVTGNGYAVGGLVGENHLSTIQNSYSSGNVFGFQFVGGFVGSNYSSLIECCYSLGNTSGSHYYVGGFIGDNAGSTVINCFSHGSVSGISNVGGFIGWIQESNNVDKCYSIGSVSGEGYLGGLIGNNINSTVTNSFWDIQTSGQNLSSGGTGKTTSEMTDLMTFTSLNTEGLTEPWDFIGNPYDDISDSNFWDIDPNFNNGYPFLMISQNVDTDESIAVDLERSSYIVSNHPNPFNPSTFINLNLWEDCFFELNVYNSRGQFVRKVYHGFKSKGSHTFLWDGEDNFDSLVSSGIYYFELNVNNRNVDLRKGILLK